MGIHGGDAVKNKAVFLDRDGVLNQAVVRNGKPYPPANEAELVLAPDAKAALRELKAQGFLLLVVTNQPDVAKGITTRAAVEEQSSRWMMFLFVITRTRITATAGSRSRG